MNDNASNTYAGLIAIVGRPNVGKSTLLNALLGQKISITSKKPQTTRHRILGILTEENKQAILVDTPGLHTEEKRAINRLMNRAASSSIAEVELIVFLVEGTHWTEDDELVLTKVKQSGAPCILVVNKTDNISDKDELLPHLQKLGAKHDFRDIVPISASKGHGVDTISKLCLTSLPEGEFWFDEDQITDRSSRFMASEIIREKLIRFTGDELPYLPQSQFSLELGLQGAQWQVAVLVKYLSAMSEAAGTNTELEGLMTDELIQVDFSAWYQVNDSLKLYGKIDNITDEQVIVSRRPFGARPGKPMQAIVGVKYSF